MLASFLLFAYDHEAFIEEALRAALAQTHRPLELIVTDDCSTDGTADVIERVLAGYDGPIETRFVRNPRNGGLASALNHAASLARGEVVVGAAGDDRSHPDRTGALVEAFRADPAVHCVFSNAAVVDAGGAFVRRHYPAPPPEKTLAGFARTGMGLLGATAAYRAAVFRDFDPLTPDLVSEDHVLPLRAAVLGRIAFVDRALVDYRVHGANLSMSLQPRAQSESEWLRLVARGVDRAGAIQRNRVRDLEAAVRRFPERRAELAPVLRANRRFLRRAEYRRRLLDARDPFRRAWLTAALAARDPAPSNLADWARMLVPSYGFRRAARLAGRAEA